MTDRPRWTPGLLSVVGMFLASLTLGCAAAAPYLLAALGGAVSGVAGEVVVRHPLGPLGPQVDAATPAPAPARAPSPDAGARRAAPTPPDAAAPDAPAPIPTVTPDAQEPRS